VIENKTNRLHRLTYLLTKLSSGAKLSTIKLAEQFDTTLRIIQLDFKEYILPLFDDDTIYYDFSIKSYVAKRNFLYKVFLSAEELAIIAILKSKTNDKYSDNDLSEKTNILFDKLENNLQHSIFRNSFMECFKDKKNEIIQIKNAINSKKEIECVYNDKQRKLQPLKILNLEHFWYLINYDLEHKEIRKYHLNSISDVQILDTEFAFDKKMTDSFDNAINAYFKPNLKPFTIELFLHNEVSKYFLRKPLNNTQRVLKTYDNGSCDIEIYITSYMEIIPTIQKYIPYIVVISPDELGTFIKENLNEYIKQIT